MEQAFLPSRLKRKRCPHCQSLFEPDPRAKNRQTYCSKPSCQKKRQRLNERAWRMKNPDSLAYQQGQSRAWYKDHPDYSRKRRSADPELVLRNRRQTRQWMRDFRFICLFDKSKEMITQLVGRNKDKSCLVWGQWLFLRLTKASPLSKPWRVRHTGEKLKQITHPLPRGRPYDLSGLLNERHNDSITSDRKN
jgi:hypothetical protein